MKLDEEGLEIIRQLRQRVKTESSVKPLEQLGESLLGLHLVRREVLHQVPSLALHEGDQVEDRLPGPVGQIHLRLVDLGPLAVLPVVPLVIREHWDIAVGFSGVRRGGLGSICCGPWIGSRHCGHWVDTGRPVLAGAHVRSATRVKSSPGSTLQYKIRPKLSSTITPQEFRILLRCIRLKYPPLRDSGGGRHEVRCHRPP